MSDELEVVIEIPSWSFRKTSLSDGDAVQHEFSSVLPCPFNYGSAPDVPSPDGEGQDVIVIGPRLPMRARVRVRPRLRVVFIDGGVSDDKLVARLDGRALGWIDVLTVRVFFLVYTLFKRVRHAVRGGGRGRTAVLRYLPQ